MRRGGYLFATLALLACKVDARDDYLGDKDPKQFGLGHAASAAEIASVDIDVSANGAGLPQGSGTPEQGAVIARARELVDFARRHGYRPDELIRIIHELG